MDRQVEPQAHISDRTGKHGGGTRRRPGRRTSLDPSSTTSATSNEDGCDGGEGEGHQLHDKGPCRGWPEMRILAPQDSTTPGLPRRRSQSPRGHQGSANRATSASVAPRSKTSRCREATFIGKGGKAAVATPVERTSRLVVLVPLSGCGGLTIGEAVIAA